MSVSGHLNANEYHRRKSGPKNNNNKITCNIAAFLPSSLSQSEEGGNSMGPVFSSI